MIRTMAQIHREEGEQRGLQIGEQLGEQRGLQAGLQQGAAALREALSGLLIQRFGALTGDARGTLEHADMGRLLAWHQRALNAQSLEEVGITSNGVRSRREE